jgi:hypothetical protein
MKFLWRLKMTIRKEIIQILSEKKMTAREIARVFGVEYSEVVEDLKHISKSLLPKRRLVIDYATCKECGYVFKDRESFKTPSKCPRCRSESITSILFSVSSVKI